VPSGVFRFDLGLFEIVLRTTIIYAILLFGLRLMGKRELGQMTAFDLVVILVISNAVQNAMVGPDTTLTGGIVAAGTLLVVNRLVAWARLRVPLFEQLAEGHPTVLIQDGKLVTANLKLEGIVPDEVVQAMREHGIGELKLVASAVLEVDGSISIIPKDQPHVIRTRRRFRYLKHR
jgi:uncharacterized membrane protein YcaP (DUF421 family)